MIIIGKKERKKERKKHMFMNTEERPMSSPS